MLTSIVVLRVHGRNFWQRIGHLENQFLHEFRQFYSFIYKLFYDNNLGVQQFKLTVTLSS